MNSANRTTLLMMILAAIAVVVAMVYYPWPEFTATNEAEGKPLFEEYDAKDVRGIDVIEFDSDKGTIERIKLVRRGERWGIPAKENFSASNSGQVGTAINALNDRIVYQVVSENQEDHIEYGVVDPAEFTTQKNVASLGKKITLTDRNNQKIADLIVGAPLKDDPKKRHVRIPGKPRVYIIDFDTKLLTTDFFRWVSSDILNLINNEPGRKLRKISIENYQTTSPKNGQPVEKKSIYRVDLVPSGNQLVPRDLQIPQGDRWKTLTATAAQAQKLRNALSALVGLEVDDVRRKSDELSVAIQFPDDTPPADTFAQMPNYGFYPKGKNERQWQFDGSNGMITIFTADGVKTEILLGKVFNENSKGGGKLNYFLMVQSAVDDQFLKRPPRPESIKNDDSDANKAYLRSVEKWKADFEKASQSASELNAIHADWYYLISEEIVLKLKPELQLPKLVGQSTSKKDRDDAETTVAADEQSQPSDDTPKADPDETEDQSP